MPCGIHPNFCPAQTSFMPGMFDQKVSFKTEKELQEAILQEKARGTPDLEIGQKDGVTFRYIEKPITKSQGVNISALKVSQK